MKRTPALVLALLLTWTATACGDEQAPGAGGSGPPPATGSASPDDGSTEGSTDGSAAGGKVRILQQTNAGGSTTEEAVVLRTQADVDAFVADLDGGQLADGIQTVYDARDAGTVLLASVVAIGCEVPTDATVSRENGAMVITPQKMPTGTKQCFAPITSVALATVDEGDLPG